LARYADALLPNATGPPHHTGATEMKIVTEQELAPFTVPHFVGVVQKTGRRQDGFVGAPKYALGDLSDETLNDLCLQFRNDVLDRAAEQRKQRGPA
jgi:hypothetical protein